MVVIGGSVDLNSLFGDDLNWNGGTQDGVFGMALQLGSVVVDGGASVGGGGVDMGQMHQNANISAIIATMAAGGGGGGPQR